MPACSRRPDAGRDATTGRPDEPRRHRVPDDRRCAYSTGIPRCLLLRPWSPGRASVGFLLDYPLFAFRSSSRSRVRSHLVSLQLPWLFPRHFLLIYQEQGIGSYYYL